MGADDLKGRTELISYPRSRLELVECLTLYPPS
jgi:hypothetical protein